MAASKTTGTLQGAGEGALVGSAFGPEGTVIGGAAGAIYGYLSSGGSSGPAPPTAGNFRYGVDDSAGGANQQAHAYQDQYGQLAAGLSSQGQASLYNGQQVQQRSAPQVAQNQGDRDQQLAALGGLNANAAALTAKGTAPMGDSVAAAQLKQGQDAAMQQSLALARSGRSLGSGASALQQAQFQNAQTNQTTNQQAAVARLQEQQNYNSMQLSALGAAQQGYGAAAGQANALNASDTGLQTTNAGLTQQEQNINNQTMAGYDQVGQAEMQSGIQASEFGTNVSEQIKQQQLAASEQYQSLKAGNAVGAANVANQNTATTMGTISGAANAYAAVEGSDRDAKKNIRPANGEVEADDEPWYKSWGATARALGITGGGDKRAQVAPPALVRNPSNPSELVSPYASIGQASRAAGPTDTQRGQATGADQAEAMRVAADQRYANQQLAALNAAPPAYAPGQFTDPGYGPSDVQLGPPGGYAPGYGAPPPGYAASNVRSKQRIADLESQLAAFGASPRPVPQAPDTDALDEAYRREGGEPSVDLRPARGYSYEYKDPARFGAGTKYGPMAQDLERTPAGASTVRRAPDGTKMVDTSRLALVNTSAISEQQRKMDELEAQVAALGGSRAQYPTVRQPDTIDLDRGMRLGGAY